ncbi:hypothetical protein SAMN05421678_105162 [Actinopolymorpha cephalotaxi]|uniref:Uncharacterized protein n=1 Tax=Actinopolymorpha cephalotaxi TaxID=504797 RepID=A0A1I2R182_9ACTN|nr:hypothetical protein [Actinopolymorpha cephalotaxi]NYH82431.1 hypothetical protein [Actinopolymorpha cephalotaxi]SFG33239.1 hypothetical protein SAMN05421678_105162 [Actinopolymorpha cephalotaxi]
MPARFNAPPNWPVPSGWTPPPHWKPDPAWGPPPYGWQVWVEESPSRSACRRRQMLVAVGVVAGLGSVVGYVQAFSAPEPEPATTFTTNTEDAGDPAAERPARARREGVGPAAPSAEVDVSRRDPAPYTVSPPDVESPPPTSKPRSPASQGGRPGGADERPASPNATPPPDALDGPGTDAPGERPPHAPGPRTRPGHDADGRPDRLGDGRDPGRDRPHRRPRFEHPVETLRTTRPATPATPAPTTPAPTTPAPATPTPEPTPSATPTPPSVPGSAAGGRGRGHAS